MSRPPQLPVSELIKRGKKAGEEDQATKRKRNDFRELKELEEQRKAGTAPAMVDIETGRDINPHIPEFIEKTPWYVPTAGPTLKHQRPHEELQKTFVNINEWYAKGTTNKIASKFRKGACENCGAMGHAKKECLDRPRAIGAKYTESDFAPDDYVQPNLSLNYDAKRDRWNGFDPSTYSETVVKEHEEMAEIAKIIKAEKIKKGEIEVDAEEEDEADEDKYADEMAPAQTMDMDSRTRITVRNLRIREDTAKYLYNLNENGPYYDPKSRSMRENPFLGVPGKEAEAARFSGENYVRYTGEVVKANEAQLFAWQARSKGIDVHATAEPTKLEILQKKFDEQRETLKDSNMKKLLESYGGEEYLETPAKELLLAQTESYVEYNRRGKIIKGEDRPLLKTKYEEDIYHNNHTSVWGSYWKDGQWGYRCCHSLMKNTYCVGAKGYANELETYTRMPPSKQIKPKPAEALKVPEKPEITDIVEKEENKKRNKKESESESSSSSSESDVEIEVINDEIVDPEKLQLLEDEFENEKEKRAKKEHQRSVKREKRKRQKERKREKHEKDGKKKRKRKVSSSSSSSDSEVDSKKKKYDPELRAAIKKVMKEQKEGKIMKNMDDRERSYQSQYETKAPSAAEVEAFNLVRIHSSDPMASYMTSK